MVGPSFAMKGAFEAFVAPGTVPSLNLPETPLARPVAGDVGSIVLWGANPLKSERAQWTRKKHVPITVIPSPQ